MCRGRGVEGGWCRGRGDGVCRGVGVEGGM